MDPRPSSSAKRKRRRSRKKKNPCAPVRKAGKSKKEVLRLQRRRRKLCKPKRRRRTLTPAPAPAPAPPATPATPPDPDLVPPFLGSVDTPLAKYAGPFGKAQAERLLWRAGFGPRPGEAQALASAGLDAAVTALTRPGPETLSGPPPVTDTGVAIGQYTGNRHHQLWWLDRMIRSNRSLVERMTLNWHDWFATSGDVVLVPQKMVRQNELLRRHALGRFDELLTEITYDPAMLIWLDGVRNYTNRENENYARELMELFTLGADRGAYTERDVREMARALCGWREVQTPSGLVYQFVFDYSDPLEKTIFGRTGTWNWEDACRLCVEHPMHPSFFVMKVWGYFMPDPPSESDRLALEELYKSSDYSVLPVLEAILVHPQLYEGAAMVTPPVVMMAGLLRASGRGIESTAWQLIMGQCGHRLFFPPDVSGWDESRWLDTTDTQGRWRAVFQALRGREISGAAADAWDPTETPAAAVSRARAYWGDPELSAETVAQLHAFAEACLPAFMTPTEQRVLRAKRQNALRQLVGASPDMSVR